MSAQPSLFPDDGITNRRIEYLDEKPDELGRRRFFLVWDDARAFAPGAPRNADGSVTRGQAFMANPQPFIRDGYVPVAAP